MSGRSVTSIVEESLRRYLTKHNAAEPLRPLPVSKSRGGLNDEFLATGINFDNTSDVLARLDRLERRSP